MCFQNLARVLRSSRCNKIIWLHDMQGNKVLQKAMLERHVLSTAVLVACPVHL